MPAALTVADVRLALRVSPSAHKFVQSHAATARKMRYLSPSGGAILRRMPLISLSGGHGFDFVAVPAIGETPAPKVGEPFLAANPILTQSRCGQAFSVQRSAKSSRRRIK